jgi:hypothetical protein
VELERLHDLGVAEVEHRGALLHHRHAGAERREHRGVLDADHAGADHDHGVGHLLDLEHAVRVEHALVVELDLRGPVRPGARGDDDVLGGDGVVVTAGGTVHGDGVRIVEVRRAAEDVDVVAQQLVADDLHLAPDDVRGAGQQVADRDVGLDPVTGAVHVALREPGQVQHGLAERFRRDRAGVDTDPAHHVAPLGDRHPLAQLRSGDGGLLAARS